jgi:hypothetical protein
MTAELRHFFAHGMIPGAWPWAVPYFCSTRRVSPRLIFQVLGGGEATRSGVLRIGEGGPRSRRGLPAAGRHPRFNPRQLDL